MKYIKTFSDNASYEEDKPNFEAPHVGYIEATDEVKYINDEIDLYDLYGSVTNGTTSVRLKINNSYKDANVSNGNFMYNWTGGTITSLSDCFNTQRITSIEKIALDTSSVTGMNGMFYQCSGMTSVNVSNFVTTAVTNMGSMFARCYALTSIDLSSFNTSGVTDFGNMFYGCSALTSLNVNNFDTSAATTLYGMFRECTGLTSINASNFVTTAVTNMSLMFYRSSGLVSIDLSNFNTSGVTNMDNMFQGCSNLSTVTMNNTNQTTFDMIASRLVTDSVASHVSIIRDGLTWTYNGSEWVSQ